MSPEAIVVANSDQVSTKEFDRFVSTYYSSKLILLGNLSQEQALRIHMYKHTLSKLANRKDPASQKFYKKFLLIAGQLEYNAHLTLDQIENEHYRELVSAMFKHSRDADGRVGTSTRIHVRSLDMTFMYGFYGSDDDSDKFIFNRVDSSNMEQAFRHITKRKKGGVICGHPLEPMAYKQDQEGTITDLLNGELASIPIEPHCHYLFAPGAFNGGHFAVIGKDQTGRKTIHFNQFQFNY